MGRNAARESRGGSNKADKLAVMAKTFPLSAAILTKDGTALCSILSSVGIGKVIDHFLEARSSDMSYGNVG